MYKEKCFRSSGCCMTVSLSESRKNDTFIVPDLLCVFVNIFLHALFVSHIDEPAVEIASAEALGLFLSTV